MRIFAAGISTETNTFCPVPTSLEDFNIQRGSAVVAGRVDHPGLDLSATWGRQAAARGDRFIFSLMASARPSGTTVRSAYESLRDEILRDLRAAMPVDIVLLMLHGAMVADGYDGCEEDLIRQVRDIAGSSAVIGVELDLHCHLTQVMVDTADIIITYKEYPHVDVNDRAREVFDLAVAAKAGQIRPTMALFDCRMIGIYPTSRQPLRAFVDSMTEMERSGAVLSMSFAHGFQFADLPHIGAKVLVVTDNDRDLAGRTAREFGSRVHALRREISFASLSLPLEQALERALASEKAPVVVADQSDNSGGGAPGDATFALRWLLDREATGIAMGIFYDPEVVRIARKGGKEARLPVRLGGKMGPSSGAPIDMEVTVLSTLDDYVYVLPQLSGLPMTFPIGDVVALRCAGIDIIVSSKRFQCSHPSIFSDLGVDISTKRVVIPKSTQHFFAGFGSLAAEVIYMAGPGAVAPDPLQITYSRRDIANTYPWVESPRL